MLLSDRRRVNGVFGVVVAFALILLIHQSAEAQIAQDIVAPTGCAMAHCDQAMTDNTHLPMPVQPVVAWRDRTVNGSLLGLGCSSNGAAVACSFRSASSKPSELRVYGPDGTALWSSSVFGSNAYLSAPMIGSDSGVIMADSSRIIRFYPNGEAKWTSTTPGGTPFSPTVTDNGEIILAALNGPVSAYDYDSGAMLAQLRLNAAITYNGRTYNGYFDTMNTPAIRGNRIYVVTQFKYGYGSSLPVGRLIALDLVSDGFGAYSFQVAWFVGFRAPSGASPTLSTDSEDRTVIFFDGAGTDPALSSAPRAFAVTDLGTSGEFLWNYRLSSATQTSPARDPRGGMWYFPYGSANLLRLSETTGEVLQTINVTTLMNLGTTYRPRSAMTISGDDNAPVMMVTAANSYFSRQYVLAIDLSSGTLLWRYRVDEGRGYSAMPWGQFPIVLNSSGEPLVVFSSYQNGVWALTSPTGIQQVETPVVDSNGGTFDMDRKTESPDTGVDNP